MNKPNHLYTPHLVITEFTLPPGQEWQPKLTGWSLMLIVSGNGYWLQDQSRLELEAGTVLLIAAGGQGRLLASQLNVMSLCYFSVIPERLSGLLTHEEQKILSHAARQKEATFQILTVAHPIAQKMSQFCSNPNQGGVSSRLTMLQLLVESLGKELIPAASNPEIADATQRLQLFLKENPQDALLEISFKELAKITHCTSRHLSRIFFDVVGMSYSDKRSEIRLARARELLATSQSKVVEVALESGYKSLSLFNLMFTRHFGVSPGRWRKKNDALKKSGSRRSRQSRRPAIRLNGV